MATPSSKTRTIEIRWPDEKVGPYLIGVQWRLMQGHWHCVGLSEGFADEDQTRQLQTADLRKLRLPAIVAQAGVELRRRLEEDGEHLEGAPSPPASQRRQYRLELLRQRQEAEALQAAQPRGRGRPAVPLAELQQVARIYAAAFRAKRPPTKAVAEALQISYAAAAKRVASCRRVGILAPGEQGKASVGMLMGRGDAASLERQIASDEIRAQRRDETDDDGEL